MDATSLINEFEQNNFTHIIEANNIKDDALIFEMMRAINNKRGNDFQYLVSCLSDHKFLEFITENENVVTEELFNRMCKIHDDLLKIYYLKKCDIGKLYVLLTMSLYHEDIRDYFMSNVDSKLLENMYFLRSKELKLRLLPHIYSRSEESYYEITRTINKDHMMMYKVLVDSILKADEPTLKLDLLKRYYFINDLVNDVLEQISDKEERKFLVESLYDIKGKELYNSECLKPFNIKNYKSALPENMTFGIEIECFGDMARPILLYDEHLLGYDVKREISLLDGLEFTSPKLSWNKKDLESIYQICAFAKCNQLKCVSRSGGHIHVGCDYLDSRDAWYWFFYLYSKFEMILYKICNKGGESPRFNIISMAYPFSKIYVENYEKFHKIQDRNSFIKSAQDMFKIRFVGINLLNIFKRFNTIEFRMPNGTIDADEIVLRILLFGNLLVAARKLSFLPLDKSMFDLLERLDSCCCEEEKFEVMLELLFKGEEDKNIFRKRYQKNSKVNDEASLAMKMKSFSYKEKGIKI